MSDTEKAVRRKRGEGSQQNERKRMRIEGKAYKTKRNKQVEAKTPPSEQVRCKCKYDCKSLNHDHKLKMFLDYYKVKDLKVQNTYLMGLINLQPINRRRKGVDASTSHKQTSVSFSIPNGSGNIVRVCKMTFMDVFGITKRRIETLISYLKGGKVTYTEKRGNKGRNKRYSDEDVKRIVDHVNTFPRQESHYSRSKSEKEYLSPDLNKSRIFRAFNEKHPENTVGRKYFFKIFDINFPKLSFRQPRTDTCDTCDLLQASIKSNPADLTCKRRLELHHRKAETARLNMQNDHKQSQMASSDVCTLSMDLQQVFLLPALTHGKMYYSRQLSVYNFGIHVGDNNGVFTFMWHEGQTGRSGNEIASAILKGIRSQITPKRKIIFWSDNCSGQNKNKMLLYLWFFLIAEGILDEVQQKFLVPGHSFLSCDRDFAQIEKRKRKTHCEVPLDLLRVIVSARLSQPYLAAMLENTDFYDFKSAAENTLQTKDVKISKLICLRIERSKPGYVSTRTTFSEIEDWTDIKVFKKNITMDNIASFLLPLECKSRLTEDKKKDLRGMVEYLNNENKSFFLDLINH